ncbi:hypothetical protein [Halorhabdus sp. CUG00001]|uniref:hypothetical protein n=1 Tax=Halorhabdus sp. CUG00001 TaxID=2600297 RepID=UPI00131A77D2|nr:hypothetical protein [Halorhabdus sp. CUG00001]
MATARFGVDPRRIAVNGGLGVTMALFGAFLVGSWRALTSETVPVTEIVFTLAVFFVSALFFLSTVDRSARSQHQGPIAVGGALLGIGVALFVPPVWSDLSVVQLLTYPFVLLWVFALVATGE